MTDSLIRVNIGHLSAHPGGVLSGTVIWTEPLINVASLLPLVLTVTGWTFVQSARSADRAVPLTPEDLHWKNDQLHVQFPPEHRKLVDRLLDWQPPVHGGAILNPHREAAYVRLHLEVL